MSARRKTSAAILALPLAALSLSGAHAENFDEWLKARIDATTAERQAALQAAAPSAVAEAKVDGSTRTPRNQLDTPATSANPTSLLDTTSASDLVAVALNLADLSLSSLDDDEEKDATSVSATVSGYALYSAVGGFDPLDPARYCNPDSSLPQWMRAFSGTFGFDEEDVEGADDDRVILAGAKFELPFWRRDLCARDFSEVQDALTAAAGDFGALAGPMQDRLFQILHPGRPMKEAGGAPTEEYADFIDALSDDAAFARIDRAALSTVSDEFLGRADLAAFQALDRAIQQELREFEQAPQLALQFTSKNRDEGDDELALTGIFDVGLNPYLTFTANGAWEKKGGDDGGSLAGQFELKPSSRIRLEGRGPLRIAMAGDAKWMQDEKATYKGQLKVTLPVWDGVELPISMTIANRTELVEETEVRGLVGFSVDTTRLVAWLSER